MEAIRTIPNAGKPYSNDTFDPNVMFTEQISVLHVDPDIETYTLRPFLFAIQNTVRTRVELPWLKGAQKCRLTPTTRI